MNTICDVFGRTRQAVYKRLKQSDVLTMQQAIVIKMIEAVRQDMPRVGGRKLFHLLKEPLQEHGIDIGRDKLFTIMSEYGLLVRRRKRRKTITTDSNHPFFKYPNLIRTMEVTYPNELWVSDITYIRLINDYCYLNLITDAYSRKIVGYCLWKNLSREGTIKALEMALSENPKKLNQPLIHHSDRGLQYCSQEYTGLLDFYGVAISMTEHSDPYENAIAERVNGILKSEFHIDKGFKTFELAKEAIDKGIYIYNEKRPHSSCNYLTPNQAHKITGRLIKKWKTNVRETV
ncbi:MAG: IS3 family transposase [Bacteroidia bacterium]